MLAAVRGYVPSHADGSAFEDDIFLPELLDAQNTIGTAASGIAGNDFNNPIHADGQIVGLGMPEYTRYGPLTEHQDFSNDIPVGALNHMYDDQIGNGSNGNTGAQVGLQAEIDPKRYSMSVS